MKTPAELKAIADKIAAENADAFRKSLAPYIAEIHRELLFAANRGDNQIEHTSVNPLAAKALAKLFDNLGFIVRWKYEGHADQTTITISF